MKHYWICDGWTNVCFWCGLLVEEVWKLTVARAEKIKDIPCVEVDEE